MSYHASNLTSFAREEPSSKPLTAANDPCINPLKTAKTRGRPPAVTINPVYGVLPQLLAKNKRPLWLDDLLFGGTLTAVGQSQNVSNVSIDDVRNALWLQTFATATLQAQGYEKRQAQRVIQAARFVASGIVNHLERTQPGELARLSEDAILEVKLSYYSIREETYRPLKPVPTEILDLYYKGDYYEYGRALRDFQLSN
ncbi:hypothetical protein AB9U01_06750 [Pseudomonas qingdaonensis]|uniref:hypothetical protein n=1 Tax=Pseudomonas qingdaonensis TaxID=2056231 RepID=UPI00351347DC